MTSTRQQDTKPAAERGGSIVRVRSLLRGLLLLALVAAAGLTAVAGLPRIWRSEPASLLPQDLSGQAIIDHLSALDEAGLANVEDAALARLKNDALDQQALLYLAIVAGLRKQSGQQEALILGAARLSLRDPRTQLSAVNIALQAKNHDEALRHLDGLLRSRPELGEQLFPVLSKLVDDKDAVSFLAGTLNTRPPWRKPLFDHLVKQPDGWQTAQKLFAALRASGGETEAGEVRQLVASLIKQKNFEQAHYVWLDSLHQARLARVQNVFDGGFDMEPLNQYFDWNIRPSKNAVASIVSRPGSSANLALRAEFVGHQGFYAGVSQHLRLLPGTYALRFTVLVQKLEASRGLLWRIRCAEKNGLLAESPEIRTSGPWVPSNVLFSVPETGCSTQLLQLETVARSGLDTKLSGILYIDDITVEPISGQVPGKEGN